jgi:DNA-directed RNA polymerase subunit L
MGSIRFDGVRFVAYSMDHEPRHVHGFYAEVEAIVDLRLDGAVSLATRTDSIRPSNASKSDVRHILTVAAGHFNELTALWEKQHGRA